MFVEKCSMCFRDNNCLIQLMGGSIHNAACLTLADYKPEIALEKEKEKENEKVSKS